MHGSEGRCKRQQTVFFGQLRRNIPLDFHAAQNGSDRFEHYRLSNALRQSVDWHDIRIAHGKQLRRGYFHPAPVPLNAAENQFFGSDDELTENVILVEPRARYFPAVRQKDCFDERQPPAHSAEHRSARHSTAEYHFSALRQAVPIRSDAPVIISMREKHQQIERIVYAARRQFFYTFVAEAFYIP